MERRFRMNKDLHFLFWGPGFDSHPLEKETPEDFPYVIRFFQRNSG